jgi:DNA-binding MarR family transcriptional regulator
VSEITYLDVVLLRKIVRDPEAAIERFGSKINTSFFEAANMLGTLKVKGYVDLNPTIGGMSKITLNDDGRFVLSTCEDKAKEPLDLLDDAILRSLASGIRTIDTLALRLNVTDRDLTYHLSKLELTGFVSSEVSAGKLTVQLTDKGFNRMGSVPAVIKGAAVAETSRQSVVRAVQKARKPESPPATEEEDAVAEILGAQEPRPPKPSQQQSPHSPSGLLGKAAEPQEHYVQDVEFSRLISKVEYYLTKYIWVLMIAVILVIILLYIMVTGGS